MFYRIASALLILSLMAVAEPLRTLAEIRALPSGQGAQNLPVEIEGTVTYFDANTENYGEPEGLVLHDGTAGCYASSALPFKERERIRHHPPLTSHAVPPSMDSASLKIFRLPVRPPKQILAKQSANLRSRWIDFPSKKFPGSAESPLPGSSLQFRISAILKSPLFPASGPHMSLVTGLHLKSNFLAAS